jgi:hypothetical protein
VGLFKNQNLDHRIRIYPNPIRRLLALSSSNSYARNTETESLSKDGKVERGAPPVRFLLSLIHSLFPLTYISFSRIKDQTDEVWMHVMASQVSMSFFESGNAHLLLKIGKPSLRQGRDMACELEWSRAHLAPIKEETEQQQQQRRQQWAPETSAQGSVNGIRRPANRHTVWNAARPVH